MQQGYYRPARLCSHGRRHRRVVLLLAALAIAILTYSYATGPSDDELNAVHMVPGERKHVLDPDDECNDATLPWAKNDPACQAQPQYDPTRPAVRAKKGA